jgi:3-deoxy-manno-octulosonate cytidylyltransferase (CMP-KDO synthetase)
VVAVAEGKGGALAVIPARYASERFPGKPLAPIAGVPMVVRVLRNVQEAALVDRVVVATDDERIAAVVRDAGGHVAMTDPALPSGSDRVWAVAAATDAAVVVNVQGDEPLLPGAVVDALVDALRSAPAFDLTTPVVRTHHLDATAADVVTVARADDGTAHYFSRATIPHGAAEVWRHVGVYAYRRAALERFVGAPAVTLERQERLEQLRALALGMRIGAVEVDAPTHAVDRPGDVAVVERLLEGGAVRTAAPVHLVVLDVDGVLTDGRIAYLDDRQLVGFDVKDGYGVVSMLDAGIEVAVVTARDSEALRIRARELGIARVHTNVSDKVATVAAIAASVGVSLDETCVVGDDDPDVAVMASAGTSAAPADASSAARRAATIRLTRPGGHGAVRELADLLLGRVP